MNLDNINKQIINLWQTELKSQKSAKHLHRVPQFIISPHSTKYKDTLLYVGINPGFSPDKFIAIGKKLKEVDKELWSLLKTKKDVENFYKWDKSKITKEYLEKELKISYVFVENYPYFNKIRKVASNYKLNFQVADLFLIRETNQNEIKPLIFVNKKEEVLTDFAKKQIKIFLNLIYISKPSIILIGNALASSIIKNYLSNKIIFDNNLGTWIMEINNCKTPIFFSGMLSGQRVLDNHSMERLEWQIKRCIK